MYLETLALFGRACTKGDDQLVNWILDQWPFLLDRTKEGSPAPLTRAIQNSQWATVKILLDRGAKNVIQSIISGNGSRNEVDLKILFDIVNNSICSGDLMSKLIKKDLQKMAKASMFLQLRMRTGLARFIKYFEQNEELHQLIETTLTASQKYNYVPQKALLWIHNGRFALEYFWRQNINTKITLKRNNFVITVNMTKNIFV